MIFRPALQHAGDSLATASFDGTWRLWDTARGTMLAEQEGHSRAVYAIAFHPDGSLAASGGFDAVTRLWDCRTGRNVLTLQGHAYGVLSVAFSANGHHVATGALIEGACCPKDTTSQPPFCEPCMLLAAEYHLALIRWLVKVKPGYAHRTCHYCSVWNCFVMEPV